MCDALMTLMKPEMDAKVAEEVSKREEAFTLKNIKNLMETLKLSAQQAMAVRLSGKQRCSAIHGAIV